MKFKALCCRVWRAIARKSGSVTKTLFFMHLTSVLLLAAVLQVSAGSRAQTVTYSGKAVPLPTVLDEVSRQTGWSVFYVSADLVGSRPVSVELNNTPILEALQTILKDQPVTFDVQGRAVFITKKIIEFTPKLPLPPPQPGEINGRVVDTSGTPLIGATVQVKGTKQIVSTNGRGEFGLRGVAGNLVLLVSYSGYLTKEVPIEGKTSFLIRLQVANNPLDEVHVIAYGTTTERLSTGSISKITSAEIGEQPVSNPLAALEGRIPGLIVTATSGMPGSTFNVQIRGKNSIVQGSNPLFIVDGVPYSDNNAGLGTVGSIVGSGGFSPFNTINPADIESIEVLKDADATAIYGSRGANGVVLITTKKGKAGKTTITANVYTGISRATRTANYLNTQQYLQMRREAFRNDGITPNATNAPDLTVWDTTRYTNFQKMLIGNTAHTIDANLSVSGGNAQTVFLLSGGYHRESTVLGHDLADSKASLHFSLQHHSSDNKFSLNFTSGYTSDVSNLISGNVGNSLNLPPDLPPLYDTNGNLNWQQGGATFSNPLSLFLNTYKAKTDNLLSNLLLNYKITPHLAIRSSFGYNLINMVENSQAPQAAEDPAEDPQSSANFGNTQVRNWVIEPQIEYNTIIKKGKLDVLLGGTWQQNISNTNFIEETGFTTDALLGALGAGSTVSLKSDSYNQYKYQAVFGRLSYNWEDRYILDISGRRDGSSRFGPGRQFANFGAAGGAWLFSNEDFFKEAAPFISFGKLRASYGITGNDQIGNYKYFDGWTSTTAYQGTSTLKPSNLYNPDYGWETNKKLEAAVDIGFLNDRILFTASVYRNLSSNQLVSYALPYETGFSGITQNLPAVVQNKGLEITLRTKNITGKQFNWSTNLNLTLPSNELLSFPGLATSTYANGYVIGKPLNIVNGYRSTGVSPTTGLYTFQDVNGDGMISSPHDRLLGLVSLNPKFYGGLQNAVNFKGIQLDIFFEFKKQMGTNYLYNFSSNTTQYPGSMYNQPVYVEQRWQKPGDITNVQEFTTGANANAATAIKNLGTSNALYGDASYIRLKTLSLSYALLKKTWLQKIKIESFRVYIQGQNLFTITDYKGADPETQYTNSIPPLKTLTAGFQIIF